MGVRLTWRSRVLPVFKDVKWLWPMVCGEQTIGSEGAGVAEAGSMWGELESPGLSLKVLAEVVVRVSLYVAGLVCVEV